MYYKNVSISNIIVLFFLFCCYNTGFAKKPINVNGSLLGRPFQIKVYDELAKTMLTNPDDSSVVKLFSDYSSNELNTETLSEITQKYSVEVSTFFFIEKIYEQEKNKFAQNYYMNTIDTLSNNNLIEHLSFLNDYFIVFVPGFRYKHAKNGGNFLNQRLLLDSAGMAYEMINIDEAGLVEDNAKIVAYRLQELSKIHSNIIVISVSKGGLEAAIALDMLPENQETVKAWINVGGILKGTPIADRWSPPLMRFWMKCGLFFIGKSKVKIKPLLNDMSYNRCKEAYKNLKIPENITIINVVAIPLGEQKKQIQNLPFPNDGFSFLADTIVKNGVVVLEVGVNHFFKDVNLNTRMVALLQYIVNLN